MNLEAAPKISYEETRLALSECFQSGVSKEERSEHPAFIKLREYTQAQETEIDRCESVEEAEFRRVEFSFVLGKMYCEAGFVEEGKDTILQAMSGALSAGFQDLFEEMRNYFLQYGTEEEIDSFV